MRELIDIVSEGSIQNLVYHSTEWGPEILSSGHIEANTYIDKANIASKADEQKTGIRGVSVTRSFHFAKTFSVVIFGLDADKLKQRFRFLPRAEKGAYDLANNHGDFRVEAEEFIVCPGIEIDSYLVSFWMSEALKGDPEYDDLATDHRFAGYFKVV